MYADVPPDFPSTAAAPHSSVGRISRREALLAEAIRMFAVRGFTSVSLDDIGAAVGIAGASIYNHFGSKLELLETAFDRGTAALYLHLSGAYIEPSENAILRKLARTYVQFIVDHPHLIDLQTTEIEHLPEDRRRQARQAQSTYIDEWVHLLRSVQPDLDPVTARITVHAALSVANDVARTPHLRRNPHVPEAVEQICVQLLRLP
jgi:AcrR family transcriptional regulator